MSQNKKKQTGKQQSSSTGSTKNGPTQPDAQKQNESDSQQSQETSAPVAGGDGPGTTDVASGPGMSTAQPSGATMETGAGDPDTDAPAGAPEGATDPEDTVNGGAGDGADEDGDDEGPEGTTPAQKASLQPTVSSVPESTNEGKPVDDNTAKMQWVESPPEAEPKGKIIQPGEEVTFDGEQVGNFITVSEDVFQKFYPRGAKRPSFTLLYRKGTQVPATAAQKR